MKHGQRPGDAPLFTARTPRVVAAVKLHRRRDRDKAGRFLAEGPQAVREALSAGIAEELFIAQSRVAELTRGPLRDDLARVAPQLSAPALSQGPFARDPRSVAVSVVTDEAMAALDETVRPQGVVAVCQMIDIPLEQALAKQPRLVAVLLDIRDPGNAGTILRTADAAGAGTVIFAGDAVDPYNGKCVRSSAGSLFHVDVVRERDGFALLDTLRRAGLRTVATSGYATRDLDELADAGTLAARTAWLFGSEAHGLPEQVMGAAADRVRVPIYGGAESLNLAAAAAICLYASARAQRAG